MNATARIDVAAVERACQRLVLRYAQLIDLGTAAEVAGLFADDAVWEDGSRRWVGVDEIHRGFTNRQALQRVSCHLCGPSLVTVGSPERASGHTPFVLLRGRRSAPSSGPVVCSRQLAGHYQDDFRLVADQWLFSRRRAVVALDRRWPS